MTVETMEAPTATATEVELTLEEQLAAAKLELERCKSLLDEKSDNEAQLRKSRERVKRLEARMLETKQVASEAKKAHETAMNEHLELEEELDSPQARLPFKATPEPVTGPVKAEETAAPVEDWRSVPLSSLTLPDGSTLPPKVLEALAENSPPLRLMGEVADWSRSGKLLTDVRGIGEAKAEKITEALDEFWKRQADGTLKQINDELVDFVREKEEEAYQGWQNEPVVNLGTSADTLATLVAAEVATVGQLVAMCGANDGVLPAFLEDEDQREDAFDALERFRRRLSNESAEAFSLLMHPSMAETSEPVPGANEAVDAWRFLPAADLGLAETTLETLWEHEIETVGELVGIGAKVTEWLAPRDALDVADTLARFRGQLTTEQIADFDRAMKGEEETPAEEQAVEPKKRGRKSKATA